MNKYLFSIELRANNLDNFMDLDLQNASLLEASEYTAKKCYHDVKDDYRVDFIFYIMDKDTIQIIDSRYDKDRTDYIVISIGSNKYLPKNSINSNNINWLDFYQLLKPFYKRYIDFLHLEDMITKYHNKNMNLFVKEQNNINGKGSKFYYDGNKNKLYDDVGYSLGRLGTVFVSEYDKIFETGEEYRIIIINEKIHSIQNSTNESVIDNGGELVLSFVNSILEVLKSSNLIKDKIFSFDIVTDKKECKLIEFHHNTDLLGHYHKTNQNDFKKYIDLLLDK